MHGLVIATLACALLRQGAGGNVAPSSVAEQSAAFQAAIDQKRFDEALRKASSLLARYVEVGRLLEPPAADAPKDAPKPDPVAVANAKGDRKVISDVLEKAIKSPRLPAEFQQKLLAQLDVKTGDGDK